MMAKSGISRAQANKSIREEALREQLRAKGLVQHVIEISEKLQDLNQTLEPNDVVRLKASADLKLKLVAKYLPDLKSIEHSGEISHTNAEQLTDEQLLNIASSGSAGATKQTDSSSKVH